jgi:hypothetical protein
MVNFWAIIHSSLRHRLKANTADLCYSVHLDMVIEGDGGRPVRLLVR